MQAKGWRTGILDLTRGESGTRGTAAEREAEANEAARILKVSVRERSIFPTAMFKTRSKTGSRSPTVLRRLRPRVVILPYWEGRHPDHYTTATLGYEACFVSGLAKVEPKVHPPRTGPSRFSTRASTPMSAPPSP
jgi:LmbE family N-acetylglucosaminyl deacetylase